MYKARDARLDRSVAIKVLPEVFAADPERIARFEREARAVAALSHPNILAIHDFATQEGVIYAAMELLEGETLRERLAAGPIPVRKVLDITASVARGLSAAHDKGLVHRDLKPENIFLTGGRGSSGATAVKLLDFGLAKLRPVSTAAAGSALATSPHPLTSEGAILGTLQYMSPEQLEGKEADARSDLFAFGAVFYEMVTGRRAFDGGSEASVIAAILEHDAPSLESVAAPGAVAAGGVLRQLDRAIRTCLEKDPGERWQCAADLARELKWIAHEDHKGAAEDPVAASHPAATPVARRRLSMAVAIALAVASSRRLPFPEKRFELDRTRSPAIHGSPSCSGITSRSLRCASTS